MNEWTFKMDYCKKQGIPPAQEWAWNDAHRAYIHHVAALFVEKDGSYYGLPDVTPWDKVLDARKYDGPFPVVAHPPCQLWGAMAAVNFARWGGEHNRPGNDGGCFASALASVNTWGGVGC